MKTVAVLAQKGGVGKTTLAVHLAVASSRRRNTAIIDLDPQASATRWSDRREAEVPVVLSAHASRLVREKERVRSAGGELLLVDTAPHSSEAALEAAKVADLILIPCRPAILDLEAVSSTLSLVRTIGVAVPVFVVLNAVAPRGRDASDAAGCGPGPGGGGDPGGRCEPGALRPGAGVGTGGGRAAAGREGGARNRPRARVHVCTVEHGR